MAMNDLDFLRQLIDLVDARKDSNEVEISAQETEIEEPTTEEDPLERKDLYLPPLQAKIEIMKKMADVGEYNHEEDDLESIDGDEPVEVKRTPVQLGRLQQLILSLEEDEPFEG